MTPRLVPLLVAGIANVLPLRSQGGIIVTDRLPPSSIEIDRHGERATSTPWQLPKPGDPLYDAKKEGEINNNKNSHLVRVFERGVFKGYAILHHKGDDWTLSSPTPEPTAKKMDSAFAPNPMLPTDAVELSDSEHPSKSDYYPTRPKQHPANVPDDYIPVKVFHRSKFIGWTYISKDAAVMLHKP